MGFHIDNFKSDWYEKWSFLGQEAYISMFEVIGEKLRDLNFKITSHENHGSEFDKVYFQRDKDGIIHTCPSTDIMWFDGKVRPPKENERFAIPWAPPQNEVGATENTTSENDELKSADISKPNVASSLNYTELENEKISDIDNSNSNFPVEGSKVEKMENFNPSSLQQSITSTPGEPQTNSQEDRGGSSVKERSPPEGDKKVPVSPKFSNLFFWNDPNQIWPKRNPIASFTKRNVKKGSCFATWVNPFLPLIYDDITNTFLSETCMPLNSVEQYSEVEHNLTSNSQIAEKNKSEQVHQNLSLKAVNSKDLSFKASDTNIPNNQTVKQSK